MEMETPNLGILYWGRSPVFRESTESVIKSINGRDLVPEGTPPWDFWLTVLNKIGAPNNRFSAIQNFRPGYLGFVVVYWNNKGRFEGFLDYFGKNIVPLPREPEDGAPKIITTLSSVRSLVSGLISKLNNQQLGLALWCDDRCEEVPLKEFSKLSQGERRRQTTQANK